MSNPLVIVASATKRSPDSRIGISYKTEGDEIILTRVNEDGLFSDSQLRPGMQIILINETDVRGMSVGEVQAILSSLEREVIIQARASSRTYTLASTVGDDRITVSFAKPREIPLMLQSMNVPARVWDRIVEVFLVELLPTLRHSLKMDNILRIEMLKYTQKQQIKQNTFHESNHEKKVLMMTNQAAMMHSNLSMAANNVLAESNALLNRHGILVKLDFALRELPDFSTKQVGKNTLMIPTALKFVTIGA